MSETNQNILTREGLLTDEQYSCKYYTGSAPLGSYGGYWTETDNTVIGVSTDADGNTVQTKAVITINPAKFGISWDKIISAKLKLYGNGACHVQGKGDMSFYRSDYQDIDITDEFSNESASPIQVNIFPIENASFVFSASGSLGLKIELSYTVAEEPEVSSIEIVTPPNKTEYMEGETFDKTGLTVKVNYVDGSWMETSEVEVSESELSTDDTFVTVNYGAKTAIQEITVIDRFEVLGESKSSADYGDNPKINLSTGRLLYTMPDLSIGAGNYAISIAHVYHSMDQGAFEDIFPGMGTGWKLNVQQYVKKKSDGAYAYLDGNGYVHNFVLFDETQKRYNDEDGLGLVLTEEEYGSTIKDESGNELEFGVNGRLIASVSGLNSSIRKLYNYNAAGQLTRVYDTRTLVSGQPREYIKFNYNTAGKLSSMQAYESGVCKQTKYFSYTTDQKFLYTQMTDTGESPRTDHWFEYNAETQNLAEIRAGEINGKILITYDAQNRAEKLSQGYTSSSSGTYTEKSSQSYTYNETTCGTEKFIFNTEITTNNGITTVYYLNRNGEGVSAFEKVGTGLKTMQKETGMAFSSTGTLSESINGKKARSAQGAISVSGTTLKSDGLNGNKNLAFTFWLKLTGTANRAFVTATNSAFGTETVEVDASAYKAWQYVSVPVQRAEEDIASVTLTVKDETGVNVNAEVCNFRFMSSGKSGLYFNNGNAKFKDVDTISLWSTPYVSETISNKTDTEWYMTENDLLRTLRRIKTVSNTNGFDVYFCNGKKRKTVMAGITAMAGETYINFTTGSTTLGAENSWFFETESADGNSVTRQYYTFNATDMQLLTQTSVTGATTPSQTTKITDYHGNVKTETDAYGVKTSYEYFSSGNLKKQTVTGADGGTITLVEYTEEDAEYVKTQRSGDCGEKYSYIKPLGLIDKVEKVCYNGSAETLYESTDYGYNAVYDLTSVSSTADGETQTNAMTYDNGTLHTVTDGAVKYRFDVSKDGDVSTFSVYEDESKITLQQQKFSNDTLTATDEYYRENSGMPTDTFTTEYDEYGRALSESYNNATKVEYTYTSTGESAAAQGVQSVTDYYAETVTSYEYDENGNVKKAEKTDLGYGKLLEVEQVSAAQTKYTFGGNETYQTAVIYDEDVTISPRVKETKVYNEDGKKIEVISKNYDYDEFGRLNRASYDYENSTERSGPVTESLHYTNTYTYKEDTGKELSLVDAFSFTADRKGVNMQGEEGVLDALTTLNQTYQYNNKGNLRHITETGSAISEREKLTHIPTYTTITQYDYDNFNRLTSEINGALNVTRYYGYVDGKLRTVTTNGEMRNYSYNARGQLSRITDEDGIVEKVYTYDNYGNRTSVAYSETDLPYVLYEWERGNKLKGITAYPHFYYGYTYDKDGIRSEKVIKEGLVEKFKIRYHYNGTTLLGEDRTDGKIRYFYDSTGICGFTYNGTLYSYVKDILGNVIMIMDRVDDLPVARYYYDAYGNHKVLNPDGSINTSDTFIGNINPIRYRGYYYDTESGLYYLQSRYYDPTVGVFISPDSVNYLKPQTIGGVNLYCYCKYNPVMGYDPSGKFDWGKFWGWVLLGVCTVAAVGLFVVGTILSGGTSFALLGAILSGIGTGFLTGAISSIFLQGGDFSKVDPWKALASGAIGAVIGGVSGYISGAIGMAAESFGKTFGYILSNANIGGLNIGSAFSYIGGTKMLVSVFATAGEFIGLFIGGALMNRVANDAMGQDSSYDEDMEAGIESIAEDKWQKVLGYIFKAILKDIFKWVRS